MQAAVMIDRNMLEYRDVPDPALGEGEVLVCVRNIGICGTDAHLFTGMRKIEYPHISGHELSGEVVETAHGVEDISSGDRVSIDPNIHCGNCHQCRCGRFNLCVNKRVIGISTQGGFAEYVKAPKENVFKLPGSMPLWKGALIEPVAVALHASRRAGVSLGDHVALFGAGTIGLILIQILKASGAQVTVIERTQDKLELASNLGADRLVNVLETDLRELSENDGRFNKVIDAAGVPQTFEESVRIASPGATVVWFGLPSAEVRLQAFSFVYHELSVCASMAYTHEFTDAIPLIENGELALDPLVTHRFGFKDILAALKAVASGQAIKVMVEGSHDSQEQKP